MYKFFFNNQSLKNRRRELRANQTKTEEKLWEFLRNRKLGGFKFNRQYSIGSYILDFYCPEFRFGIELNGNQHNENEPKIYDKDRERILQASSVHIIRFWNDEVENDIAKVLEKILFEIKKGSKCNFDTTNPRLS